MELRVYICVGLLMHTARCTFRQTTSTSSRHPIDVARSRSVWREKQLSTCQVPGGRPQSQSVQPPNQRQTAHLPVTNQHFWPSAFVRVSQTQPNSSLPLAETHRYERSLQ